MNLKDVWLRKLFLNCQERVTLSICVYNSGLHTTSSHNSSSRCNSNNQHSNHSSSRHGTSNTGISGMLTTKHLRVAGITVNIMPRVVDRSEIGRKKLLLFSNLHSDSCETLLSFLLSHLWTDYFIMGLELWLVNVIVRWRQMTVFHYILASVRLTNRNVCESVLINVKLFLFCFIWKIFFFYSSLLLVYPNNLWNPLNFMCS